MCTIVNVLVTIIALVFVFKVDVSWTGSLGDTFGGLLSPVIGGVSIYFIYQTFAAQREQLEDQIRATNFSGSSLYFSEISDMIFDIRAKFKILTYGDYVDEQVGEDAIEAIKEDLSGNNLPNDFIKNGLPVLQSLNEQMSRITLVATIGSNLKDDNLGRLFKDKFKNELEIMIRDIVSVFESVRRCLKLMESNDEYRKNNNKHVSWMAWQYESYYESIANLHELVDLLVKTDFPDRVYKVEINKISIVERLNRINLISKWTVK